MVLPAIAPPERPSLSVGPPPTKHKNNMVRKIRRTLYLIPANPPTQQIIFFQTEIGNQKQWEYVNDTMVVLQLCNGPIKQDKWMGRGQLSLKIFISLNYRVHSIC